MRPEICFVLIAALWQGVRAKEKEEIRLVFGASNEEKAAAAPLEFIENTTGQTYLDVITFRDRYVLDLLKFNNEIREGKVDTNPENTYQCPRQLLENFGLRGLTTPSVVAIPPKYCPAMKQSCCLPSDLEDLETIWKSKYSPKIKYFQYYFKYYINDILAHHSDYLAIADSISKNHRRDFCRKASERFLKFQVDEEFVKKVSTLLNDFLDFDYRLKRGFMCLLCDYSNLGGIDPEEGLHSLNRDTCQAVVNSTMDFQYLAHKKIYRYINTVSVLTSCQRSMLNQTDEEPQLNYLPVYDLQHLEVCNYARQNGFNIFANCLRYCSDYQIWRPLTPTYAPLESLAKIHQQARDFLFVDKESLKVAPPKDYDIKDVVPSKRDRFDLFGKWSFVFSDSAGVRFNHFTDPQTADF